MIVIGLTGSIGMGKSAVAAMFAKEDVPVFDADAVVHRLQARGGRLVPVIEAEFPGTTTEAGVDRAMLGARVFGDAAALKRLESIVHPAVATERALFLDDHHGAPIVVFDIPLLFEKGRSADIDYVIVVSAPADLQRKRVLARPGMTPQKFAQIAGLQMPDVRKRALADCIIDTGTSMDVTRARVREVIACLSVTKRSS